MQQVPQTGNYVLVDIGEAVRLAKTKLGISQTTIHDTDLYTYAYNAVIRMNPLTLLSFGQTMIDVVEGVATLPNGLIRLLGIRYCDKNGLVYGPILSDFDFVRDSCCTFGEGAQVTNILDCGSYMRINNNTIEFKYIAEAPAKLHIAYKSRDVDNQGFVMIRDYMIEAVQFFICWNFAQQFPTEKNYSMMYQEWKKNWTSQRSMVVSYDAQQSWNRNMAANYNLSHARIISL